MERLRAHFLDPLPDAVRAACDSPDLAAGLHAAWAVGQSAHPDVRLDPERFAAALGARRAEREFSWRDLVAADFFLAVASLENDPQAMRTFEATMMGPLARKLGGARAVGRDADAVEATVRTVRESMFVGTEKRKPKLAVYTGQVPLGAWILLVAKRELASLTRKKPRETPVGDARVFDEHAAPGDTELIVLLRAHRGAFEQVITRVMGELEPGDRDLLRWSVKEGASIDTIAPRLGINRATVARRLARIRERLADAVRAELRARLRVGAQTFDSLCAKMMPELDLSLSKVL